MKVLRRFSLASIILGFVIISISCAGRLKATDFEIEITELITGSEASIRALHVIDKNIVWASGSNGQYFLSANGGDTWKIGIVEGAENDDLRSIFAWGAEKAQVFGTSNPGRGYMTQTAGEDWQIIYEDTTSGVFFNSMSYADEFRGIALSDPTDSTSYLIKTVDGGLSWERVSGLPVLMPDEYNFAASNSCIQYNYSGKMWIITGGGASRVFSSEDNGVTWKASQSGLANSIPSGGIFSVSFLDDDRGIIVGGTYDKPELNDRIAAFTLDGGKMWVQSETMPVEYRSCVFWMKYRNRDMAVAVGKTGIDISVDHGNSWHNISSENYYTGRAIPGTNRAFLAGSEGRIARIVIKRKRNNGNESEPEQEINNEQ